MHIVVAMLLDAVLGDPNCLPHPVSGIGKLITFLEGCIYGETHRKRRGFIFCALVILCVGLTVYFILELAAAVHPHLRFVLEVYLLYAALAYRSLKDEAIPIASALADDDIAFARRRLARIVGRDTFRLTESGVVRATVETIAESYIDGIVSVLFYMVLGYFLGYAALFAWVFKAVSTMDSMVGYDDEQYGEFGFAAAKLDDVMNFVPARLGALMAVVAVLFSDYDCKRALRVFLRDRLKHKSPNSAHGESVFAGLLGIRLSGGAYYDGVFESRPWIGDGVREPVPADIWLACDILDRAYMLSVVVILVIIGGLHV